MPLVVILWFFYYKNAKKSKEYLNIQNIILLLHPKIKIINESI